MQFDDELAGGVVLVRPALQSPDYVPGASGWAVMIDGSAEFNDVTIRGGTTVSGIALYYDGTPALGNLFLSIAAVAGTDAFGNDYSKGVTVYDSSGSRIRLATGGGSALEELTPPTVTGVTWANGTLSASNGSRLGTNTPATALASPYNTATVSRATITLYGNPETSNGDVLNEIFMSTARVWITGALNVVGSLTAANLDYGTGSAVMSAVASVDVPVTFNKTFPNTPRVTALLRGNPTLPAGSSNLNIRAFNITATGCTMRVADQGGVARTLTHAFDWHAESD